MTRDEIITILIEDRFNEWIYARCPDGLEHILEFGWKGYDNFTDEELYEAFNELDEDNFDKETAEKIKSEKKRLTRTGGENL